MAAAVAVFVAVACSVAMPFTAAAQTPAGTPTAVPANALVRGEVKKIDKDGQKITLKHGDIQKLDMPGMTMVFKVPDPALLDKAKAGDQVRFDVEKRDSAIVLTVLELAN